MNLWSEKKNIVGSGKMLKEKKRNGLIDLYRLLFALVIMAGHSVNIGMEPPFPFAGVGIFVEFFYLLTGYYTILHFNKQMPRESSEWMGESLKYTFKKFVTLIPYVIISVAMIYLYEAIMSLRSGGGYRASFSGVIYMPFEMLLTNYIFAGVPQKVGALYFLAAMIVVFPVFCILCQCKNHTIKLGVALYAMLFYYHDVDWGITADYPQVLFRAFCGMCMGIVVWYLVTALNKVLTEKVWYLGVLGNLLLLTSMVLSGVGINNRRIQLLCIFIGTTVMFLKATPFCDWSNKFTDYASKISMVIYIFHWTIGRILNPFILHFEIKLRMILYYLVTFIVSMLMLYLISLFKRRKKKNCRIGVIQ